MLLLFVGDVMNLWPILRLTLIPFAGKSHPGADFARRTIAALPVLICLIILISTGPIATQ